MKAISIKYADAFKKVDQVSTVDGVRLETQRGWVLIRPSGTEPLLRITVEGKTQEDVESLMKNAQRLVKQVI